MHCSGNQPDLVIGDEIAEIERLEKALEDERIRHAACGVIALSNTPDSAKQARQMKDEYWSASCTDVANAVDREMKLRDELAECLAREARLRESIHKTIEDNGHLADGDVCTLIDIKRALALPTDDTSLKEYKRKVLLDAADNSLECCGPKIRRMAEEV